jgi:hypothetical protein
VLLESQTLGATEALEQPLLFLAHLCLMLVEVEVEFKMELLVVQVGREVVVTAV